MIEVPLVFHLVQGEHRFATHRTAADVTSALEQVNKALVPHGVQFTMRKSGPTPISAPLLELLIQRPPNGPSPLQRQLVGVPEFDPAALNIYVLAHLPWPTHAYGRYRAVLFSDAQGWDRLAAVLCFMLGVPTPTKMLLDRLSWGLGLEASEASVLLSAAQAFANGPVVLPDLSTPPHHFFGLQLPPQELVLRPGNLATSRGSTPWFNPYLKWMVRLTTYDKRQASVEVDAASLVSKAQTVGDPSRRFLIYQHWDEPDTNGLRDYRVFDAEAAEALGGAIRGIPVEKLILVVTTFDLGALKRLAVKIAPQRLQMLGCFLVLSNDDLVDTPELVTEMAEAASQLGARRLSIVSRRIDAACEERLLARAAAFDTIGVSLYDEAKHCPTAETPRLTAAFSRV
ncbi:MAG TPA: hypothetical protein VGO93_11835 [Candidatus Xenobia bacterium]